jgi:hypothetical protein
VAAELCDGRVTETNIQLTPVGQGRFEVYLDGKKLYDRKEAGDKDFLPSLREVRKAQTALREALDAAPAGAAH